MVSWHSAPCCAMASTYWHQAVLHSKDFSPQEDIYLVLFSAQGNSNPLWCKVRLSGAQSIRMETVRVWMIVKNIQFFSTILHPLSSDLLTERQAGVRVQVTGASIVAISVTQLTAWCYSAICTTRGWRNNGCLGEARNCIFTKNKTLVGSCSVIACIL